MINSIKVKGVHGVTEELSFEKGNRIMGQSLLGKTTILNCIMACYSGYFPGYQKSLPDGSVELTTDQGDIIISNNRIVGGPELNGNIIRNIIPGNFFKLNKSTVDQRETISKILGIDTSILDDIDTKLKKAQGELKVFKSKKDQITDDIIRLEGYVDGIDGILDKPTKVEHAKDNSLEIVKAYDKFIGDKIKDNELIAEANSKIESEYNDKLKEITNRMYDEEQVLDQDIILNRRMLSDIKARAEEAKQSTGDYNCESCGSLIKGDDKTNTITQLRESYAKLDIELKKSIRHRDTIIQDRDIKRSELIKPKLKELYEIGRAMTLEFKADTVGIKYQPADNDKYDQYLLDLNNYNDSLSKIKVYQDEIELKSTELRDLNSISAEKEIKSLLKEKSNFNKILDDKVKETGLDIRLFKTLKNGNIKDTFEIYDNEGNRHGATSTGNELYIELLIAKLFIDYLKLDFILIDRYESIGINLRSKIIKECKGLQVIATEVSKDKKIVVKKI